MAEGGYIGCGGENEPSYSFTTYTFNRFGIWKIKYTGSKTGYQNVTNETTFTLNLLPEPTPSISQVTGLTVYSSTATTSYSTMSGLNGVRITGLIKDKTIVSDGITYNEFYVLFDKLQNKTVLGFRDANTNRIIVPSTLITTVNMNDICPA